VSDFYFNNILPDMLTITFIILLREYFKNPESKRKLLEKIKKNTGF
jgi:hypothetical protein